MTRFAPGVVLQRSPLSQVGHLYLRDIDFVADRMLPPAPVNRKAGSRFVFTEDSFRMLVDTARGATGKLNTLDREQLQEKNYKTVMEGLKRYIDTLEERDIEQSLDLNEMALAASSILRYIGLAYELKVYNIVTDPLKVGAAIDSTTYTGVGLGINKDFAADVEALLVDIHERVNNQCGRGPNRIAMGYKTALKLGTNAKVRERIIYTTNQTAPIVSRSGGKVIIDTTALAAFFQVDEVVVSSVQYSANAKGAAAVVNTRMWDDDLLLAYVAEEGSTEEVQMGRSFFWEAESGPNGEPLILPAWEEEGGLVKFVGGYTHRDPQVFNKNCAALYNNLNG